MSSTPAALPMRGHAERVFAGAVYLTGLVLVLPLAPFIGTIVYLTVRRRRPFAARHGLQAAGWQASMLLLTFLINIVAVVLAQALGYRDVFSQLAKVGVLGIPALWPQLPIAIRLLLMSILAVNLLNISVLLQGAVAAFRGRGFTAPVIGPLFDRTFRASR